MIHANERRTAEAQRLGSAPRYRECADVEPAEPHLDALNPATETSWRETTLSAAAAVRNPDQHSGAGARAISGLVRQLSRAFCLVAGHSWKLDWGADGPRMICTVCPAVVEMEIADG